MLETELKKLTEAVTALTAVMELASGIATDVIAEETPKADPATAEETPKAAPAPKKKVTPKKEAAKPKPEPESEAVEEIVESDILAMLRKCVGAERARLNDAGEDSGQAACKAPAMAVLAEFGATRMDELKDGDYAEVHTALSALVGE